MKYKCIYILFLFINLIGSCKKLVSVDPAPNQVLAQQVFENDQTASSAISDLYIGMNYSTSNFFLTNGGTTIFTGLSSDELATQTQMPNEVEFNENNISPLNIINENQIWIFAYKIIYNTNACIEGLNSSKTLTPALKKQLLGEAKFIRSFLYFNLVNLYGDVPFVTGTDYKITSSIGRTPASQVYASIINDLIEVEELLPQQYVSKYKVRANKFAAAALLAKVYLYSGDYINAEKVSTFVINSNKFVLCNDLNQVFVNNSSEAILQLLPVNPGYETTEGELILPYDPTIVPNYTITPELLKAFEPNDLRRKNWVDSVLIDTDTFYYPHKYKLNYNGNTNPTESYMLFRFGEQYLIRAEAYAKNGKVTEGTSDLNQIRLRAGLTPYTSLDQATLLSAIFKERRIELFSEWGNRWFDLKRSGKIISVLENIKPEWKNTDTLYPIPLNQIFKNPAIKQNPGY